MEITIQNQKRTATVENGRYFYTFTPRSAHDVLRIHHDNDCIGDTQLKKIQLERGTSPTAFETPQENHRALSGLFADLRSLNLELSNPNSDFWGKIRSNNNGMLVEYYNKTIKSEMALTADAVSSRITNLLNGDYASFDQRLNALQAQVKNAAVTSTVQQLADRYTRQIEAIDGRVSTVQQKADSLTSRIAQAQSTASAAATKASEVKQTLDTISTYIGDRRGKYTTLTQDIEGIRSRVSDSESNYSTIRQSMNTISADVATLKSRNSVTVTNKGIVLSSGEIVDGKKLASMIALDPQNVNIISRNIRVDGNMLVNGSITSDKLAANSVTAGHIQAGAINGTHITADSALVQNLLAQDAFIRELTAKQAFISSVSAIRAEITEADITKITSSQAFIEKLNTHKILASQIDTETLNGKTINGVTLSGSSAIKIGERGSLKPVGNTLQIQAPNDTHSNSGVTVQISGKVWGDTNSTPSGVFIVMDPNFGSSNLYQLTNDILLTVRGRIAGAVPFKGNTQMATPIMTNFAQDDPIKGLFAIRFIGFDQDAHDGDGGIYFHDGTNGKPSTWWSYPNTDNSDKRLKENIHLTQHSSLALIDQLNFYEFDWKVNRFGNRKKHTNIGILADELQQLDSSLVFEEGDDKIKNIDTFRLLNVAVKAIQELNNKITHLERKYQHG